MTNQAQPLNIDAERVGDKVNVSIYTLIIDDKLAEALSPFMSLGEFERSGNRLASAMGLPFDKYDDLLNAISECGYSITTPDRGDPHQVR